MRNVLIVLSFILLSYQCLAQNNCTDGLTPATAFISLGSATSVSSPGVYYFNISNQAFSTYVDASGYVQIAIDFGNGTGDLPQSTTLTQSTRGILNAAVLSSLTDIESIRLSHSGGLFDVTTSQAELIDKVQNNITIYNGQIDNAFNMNWSGTNSVYINTNAGCNSNLGSSLHQNIVHVCGYSGSFMWAPSSSTQRVKFSDGEIPSNESLHLWARGNNLLGCCDSATDCDSDGIPDTVDKDDDNDGIPDIDESFCNGVILSDITFYGDAITSVGIDSISLTANAAWRSSYSNQTFNLPIHIEYTTNIHNHFMFGLLPVGATETITNWNDQAYKMYEDDSANSGVTRAKVPNAWDWGRGTINFHPVELDVAIDGKLTVTVAGEVVLDNILMPLTNYKIAVSSLDGGTISGIKFSYGNNPCIPQDYDTDKDGIPDRLDLDSDGDKCVDAFEGDGSFSLADMDDIGRLLGGVDQNAGSNSYGIPLIATSGQDIGVSQIVYSGSYDARECQCIASNNPTDSDGDGVCDAADQCSTISDALIGTACDDGEICTSNDVWTDQCICQGTFADADGDSICDAMDDCPNINNDLDIDDDGILYCDDTCIDVNENSICDSQDNEAIDKNLKLYFSHERGFYDNAFQLQIIANDPAATIKYSISHVTIPSTSSGTIYNQAINVAIPNDGVFVVKAMAYTATDTTIVETHSYTFLNQVFVHNPAFSDINQDAVLGPKLRQGFEDLPAVSIYVDHDSDINDTSDQKISIEWLYPHSLDEGPNHQVDAGIQFSSGGVNGAAPKRGLKIYFRKEHGYSKLDYPLFENYEEYADATETFDRIYFRNCSHDSTIPGRHNMGQAGTYIRQRFAHDLQLQMGNLAPHGRFTNVFLNGQYYGMFDMHERPTRGFMEEYVGGDGDQYDAIKQGAPTSGTVDQYQEMVSQATDYTSVKDYMDVQSFMDFVLILFHSANLDYGTNKNWRATGPSEINTPEGAKWHFFCWDMDTGLNWHRDGLVAGPTTNYALNKSPGNMYATLKSDIEFKYDFADRVQCNFYENGPMTKANMLSVFQNRVNEIENAVVAEHLRWTNPNTYWDKWLSNIQLAEDFIDQRETYLLDWIENDGMYPIISAVEFSHGEYDLNSGTPLTLTNPNPTGVIYYTNNGEDPRLPGGGINPNAMLYSSAINLPDGVHQIFARVFDSNQTNAIDNWSAACCPKVFYVGEQHYDDLVINEIHYNPDDFIYFNPAINAMDTVDGKNFEFVELTNKGTEPIHLYGTRFSKGIQLEIEELIVLQPDSFFVFAEDPYWFEQKYGIVPDGNYSGKLDNGGEKINYKDPLGNFIDSLKYDDGGDWPGTADKGLYSLALKDNSLDNALPSSWAIQSVFTTPRAENFFTDFGDHGYSGLVINEIHYNPFDSIDQISGEEISGKKFEFIEIKNISAAEIDLTDVEFTRGITYAFPADTKIQPNEFIVLAEDKSSFEDRYGFPAFDKYDGKLDNEGEILWLQKITDNGPVTLDAVTYSSSFPWDTQANGGLHDYSLALIDGNVNNASRLNWKVQCNSLFTPGAENDFTCFNGLEYPGLTINEIHYKPAGGIDLEYLEIANHSNVLINLEDVSLSSGIFYVFESVFLPSASAAPGNKIVLAKDSTAFHNAYGMAPHGEYIGSLGDDGETLRIQDIFGVLIDEVTYSDTAPWDPTASQGNHSLALMDGSLDNSLPENWCVQDVGISPFAVNSFADTDNDMIIDCLDTCPGFDNSLIGMSCEDGDPCTSGETFDTMCNCSGGTFQDADNDGVCDANDACNGQDDALIGSACSDGDPCTEGETYDSMCNCSGGTFQDSDGDGVCDANDACNGQDDADIGTSCSDGDPCTSGETYDSMCNCSGGTFQDSDGDGVCDADDQCANFDDALIGEPCNDGDNCTTGEVYLSNCACGDGALLDTNNNDVCDIFDGTCNVIYLEDFETGTSIWQTGGDDAHLVMNSNSPEGDYSVRIRDNSGVSSSVYTSTLDLSSVELLKIRFQYQAVGMETNKSFALQLSQDNGTSFTTIQTWVSDTDFTNDDVYFEVVNVPATQLSNEVVIRFECLGTINSDEVFLDKIILESCQECVDYISDLSNPDILNNVSANISIESNGTVPTNNSIQYSAGQEVNLMPGFEVELGALFHAFISPCD